MNARLAQERKGLRFLTERFFGNILLKLAKIRRRMRKDLQKRNHTGWESEWSSKSAEKAIFLKSIVRGQISQSQFARTHPFHTAASGFVLNKVYVLHARVPYCCLLDAFLTLIHINTYTVHTYTCTVAHSSHNRGVELPVWPKHYCTCLNKKSSTCVVHCQHKLSNVRV